MWPFWDSEEDRARREQEERRKKAQEAHAWGCLFSVLGVLVGLVIGFIGHGKTHNVGSLIFTPVIWGFIGYGVGRFTKPESS